MGKVVSSEMLMSAFMAYVHQWHKLEFEYNKIPSWRTIKQIRNIRKREKLTKAYDAQLKEWGIT